MIQVQANIQKGEFEALLDNTITTIETTLAVGVSLSNVEFEATVFKALVMTAKGTPLAGTIERTKEREFPDIQVQNAYGVEVKQSSKEKPIATGNSIFESSRVAGVEDIYLVMAYNTRKDAKVAWRRYEEAISGIAITHSPRYKIDFDVKQGKSFFDSIGVSYDKFRRAGQDEQMEHVRTHYTEKGGSNLWWLREQERPIAYRYYANLNKKERARLLGACYFLCPEIFGRATTKFHNTVIYAFAQGIISHNWRDAFTGGGRVSISGVTYPRIVSRAVKHLPYIYEAIDTITDETLSQFWSNRLPPEENRFEAWLNKVAAYYTDGGDIMEVLQNG